MAIAIAYKGGTAVTTNAASYAGSAYSPSGTALLVMLGYLTGTTTSPGSATGWGLTWTAGTAFTYNGGADSAYLFYTTTTSAPGNGTPTIWCTGDNATGGAMCVFEVTGADNNAPIRQLQSGTGISGSPSLTFGTAPLTVNGLIGGYGMNRGTPSGTVPSGWTATSQSSGYTSPSAGAVMGYDDSPSGGTVHQFTSPTSGTYGAFILEINVQEYGYADMAMAAFTLSSSGSVTAGAISGTALLTMNDFTVSSTGLTESKGTLNSTLSAFTVSSTASTEAKGTFNSALSSFTLGASGSIPIYGIFSQSISNFILSSNGSVTAGAVQYINDIVVRIPRAYGTADITLQAFSVTSAGSIPAFAILDKTLSNFTLSSSGSVPSSGTLSKTLDNFTLSANGTVANGPIASLNVTLAPFTVTSAGSSIISGSLVKTLDNFTLVSAGTSIITGAVTKTLENFSLASSGSVIVVTSTGSLDKTLANFTLTSAGSCPVTANLDKTLSNFTVTSAGTTPISGNASIALSSFTLASSGVQVNEGELSATLGNATLNAEGFGIAITLGQVIVTLAGANMYAWGVVGKPYKHKAKQKHPVSIARNNIVYRRKRW